MILESTLIALLSIAAAEPRATSPASAPASAPAASPPSRIPAPKPLYPNVIDMNEERPPARDVVVIVNGHSLHDRDLEIALRFLGVNGAPTPAQRTAALDRLIENKLFEIEALHMHALPTEETMQQLLDGVKTANGLTDATLEAAVVEQGMTLAEYKKNLEAQFIRMRVLHSRFAHEIKLSDADVKAAAARDKISEADARGRLLQAAIEKRAPAYVAALRADATITIVKP